MLVVPSLNMCVMNMFCPNVCLYFCVCVLFEMGTRNRVCRTLDNS
jgi:hypothetical protein